MAVLSSGGLDSSALLSDLARDSAVFPVYVEAGLAWEQVERKALQSYIDAFKSRNVASVTVLSAPARPLYGNQHWSVTGTSVPDAQSPDAAMFMPGRNIMLIGVAAVWCSINDVSRIAIGSLGSNPFPDATPEFFESFGKALSSGLAHAVTVEAPFRGLSKPELILAHSHLPLELTFTCASPERGGHCGRCNKCQERQSAFARSGVNDRTAYATTMADG